jgi:hypothetical protein
MKTILLLILSATLPSAAWAKSVPVELIQTVIGETIKSRIPNPKDPKLLGQLIYDISMGKPERAVEEAFESYKPENIKNDAMETAQFEILKLVLPVVGVYAETAKQVYGVVETYVNDWQDWAIQNRVEEFHKDVLSKTTVGELDAAWNDYYYGTGPKFAMGVESRMLGVIGANISGIVAKMKEAYQGRRAELERKEKLARITQERIRAKVEARQQLLAMKDRAERRVVNITEMLEFLKLPATPDNVIKYIKDKRLYAGLEADWNKELDKRRAAREPVKTGDPETDKILVAVEVSQKQVAANSAASFSPPDFSGLLREYGLNSDRLLTNNVSGEEYLRLRGLMLNSAFQVNRACMEPYFKIIGSASTSQEKIKACQASYDRFTAEAAEVDKRLNEYGEKLKKDLSALTLKGDRDATLENLYSGFKDDFSKLAEARNLQRHEYLMQGIETGNNNAEDYDKWVGWSWAGKQNPDLKTMEKYRDGLAGVAAVFETLAPVAQEKARDYAVKVADYEREYKDALSKYSELNQKSAALAELYEAGAYDFRAQLRQFAYAQARLGEPFMSPEYAAQMRGMGGKARALQKKWDEELAANRRWLGSYGAAPEEMRKLAAWQSKGGAMAMTRENFEKHYAGRLKPALDPAGCGIEALEEGREGFFNREKALRDGCFLDLASHRKQLAALEERVLEAAGMDFYAKRETLDKKFLEMSEALKTIPVKVQAAETETALAQADKILGGFTLFSQASRENLKERYDAYAARVKRAEEVEGNLKSWVCASSGAAANKKYLDSLPWKVTPDLEKFCLDDNNFTAVESAGDGPAAAGGTGRKDPQAEAQAFYEKFRAAYEGRNAAQVMALISPDWGAGGDDTTLEDLEENLRTNFRLYDEIKFSFSGLRVTPRGAVLQACYDTVITSRIFKRNLRHEEKASVCDELKEEGEKLRITRTLSGRYWYVK